MEVTGPGVESEQQLQPVPQLVATLDRILFFLQSDPAIYIYIDTHTYILPFIYYLSSWSIIELGQGLNLHTHRDNLHTYRDNIRSLIH